MNVDFEIIQGDGGGILVDGKAVHIDYQRLPCGRKVGPFDST